MRVFVFSFIVTTIILIGFQNIKLLGSNCEASQSEKIDLQLDKLTKEMVKNLSKEKKNKIAIMEFPDLHGNVSELGKFIPEELTTRLFKTKRFTVVERSLLNKVLEEQNLGMSGLVDASSAAQVGKMLGVEAIVTGTITDMGNTIRINARIIATETASVFAVSSASINKEEHIVAMMNRFAQAPTITGNNTQAKGSGNSHKKEEKATSLPKVEADFFEFQVVSATFVDDSKLQIVVSVTNNSNSDKELFFSCYENSIFDNQGQEYKNAIRKIGNKSANGSSHFKHMFIKELPTRITFEYSMVDPAATSIALLNLGINSKASLRNIPIEK